MITKSPASSDAAPLNLFAPIEPSSEAWQDAAERLQGNIVEPHGRRYSALLAFKIAGADSRRELGKLALRWLTSAGEQERRALPRKRRRRLNHQYVDTKLFGFVYLSASGYRKLGYQEELNRAFVNPSGATDNWFLTGLSGEQQNMKFPDPNLIDIEDGYKDGIDAVLLLACDNLDVLNGAVEDAQAGISRLGRVRCIERGEVKRNNYGQSVEPFGFPDSISMPQVFNTGESPVYPSNLLVNDPLVAGDANAFGSYLVYCKLEQDKPAFDEAVHTLATNIGAQPDLAEALVIGRFKDGTPVTASSCPLGPHAAIAPDYANDLGGTKCPFQAHIRKVNPRLSSQRRPMSNPLFRRGVPYESVDPSTNGCPPKSSVGLLFLAFQADIGGQFGSILLGWVNSATFQVDGTGTDALMGNKYGAQKWPVGASTMASSIARFVTLKGGEFLFAPSLPFFESLLS